jgi:hypothetical protein
MCGLPPTAASRPEPTPARMPALAWSFPCLANSNWRLALGNGQLALGAWQLAIGNWRFATGNAPLTLPGVGSLRMGCQSDEQAGQDHESQTAKPQGRAGRHTCRELSRFPVPASRSLSPSMGRQKLSRGEPGYWLTAQRVPTFRFQLLPPGPIIARLYVMGGTIAQSPVGCQASPLGQPPVVSTRPTTLVK